MGMVSTMKLIRLFSLGEGEGEGEGKSLLVSHITSSRRRGKVSPFFTRPVTKASSSGCLYSWKKSV
jgi:hypothetical protein